MTINFSVNDIVRVVPSYVGITLREAGQVGKIAGLEWRPKDVL